MEEMGLLLSLVVFVFVAALGLAALLLPFYVIAIHGQLCKIRVLLEGMVVD